MADVLLVNDDDKIGVEQLLLGDIEITCRSCDGEEYTIHGLQGNSLSVKRPDGVSVSLLQYISDSSGNAPSTIVVTTPKGTYTLDQLASGLDDVQFEIADLQTKYNNLKG